LCQLPRFGLSELRTVLKRRDWERDIRLVSFVHSIAAVEMFTIELSAIRAARLCDIPILGAGCWESGMLYSW
jgi:hypothetical protein